MTSTSVNGKFNEYYASNMLDVMNPIHQFHCLIIKQT